MQEINSVSNNTIKEIKKLKQKKYRQETQRYMIEGFHLIKEALRSRQKFSNLLGTKEALVALQDEDNFDLSDDRIIQISDVIAEHLSSTKNTQQVFMTLKVNQPRHYSFSSGRWVLLDDLADPGNVGTIIRTADAAGFEGVVVSPETVDLYNPKTQRAMQGSQFHIQIVQWPLPDALTSFKEHGISVVASMLDKNADDYHVISGSTAIALIIGNEAHGVQPAISELADRKIYVPIYGRAESLNAAVAAGLMIYQVVQ